MKVLHVIVGLNVGGAERSLFKLSENLILHNIDIKIVTLGKPGKLAVDFERLGIDVYCLDLVSVLQIPTAFLKLVKIVKDYNPSVVHTWMYHSNLFGGLVAYFLGKPVIWSIRSTHASLNNFKLTNFVNIFSIVFSYFIPTEIICVSESSKLSHVKLGYNDKIVTVLPNGYEVDNRFLNSLSAPNDLKKIINSNSLLITSVGRDNEFKDHDTFIETACNILNFNQNIYFVIVGEGLDYNNQKLVNKILSKNLNLDKFLLLGYRTDVMSILAYSNIYCLHSVSEGFPNSLAEAMLLGVPCVSTDVGDASLMLGDEYKKFVVPAKDPKKLSLALGYLIDLPEYNRKKLGEYLKNRIQKNYNINLLTQKMIHKYESAKCR